MLKYMKQAKVKILIVSFLLIMIVISFEKEKINVQIGNIQTIKEYSDERLCAEVVSNTAPEKVKLSKKYTINITVKNCGSATWTNDKNIRLCIWQDDYDYGFRVNIPDGVEIASGEQWTFELNDFMLENTFQTKLDFQMVEEGITYFGEREEVLIKALNNGAVEN